METKKLLPGIFAGLTLCSFLGPVDAAIITFDDKTSFLNQTGATNATGPLPDLGRIASGSAAVGDITFTRGPDATALFIGAARVSTAFDDWTPLIAGNDIALSSPEDLNVDFANPVFSAGFEFVEPDDTSVGPGCNADCNDSTFEVTLLLGASMVDMFSFNAPDNVLAFVGVWSDSAFDRLEINDVTNTIDNEYFGDFYTGVSPIPVPAAVWLFGSALLGLVGLSRRRKTV